jgi:Holliday junction resolvasome RuvABC endonuclease subunit
MSAAFCENAVLAIYPFSRGFGFVLFEGPLSPFDWGVKEIKGKHRNSQILEQIKELIERYRPAALVIEDTSDRRYQRSKRIGKLYRMLSNLTNAEAIELYQYPDSVVKKFFSSVGAVTKYEIAQAIGMQIPAFAHRIPRIRKAWMSADPRQSLFDAAALGLVHYGNRGTRT